jgi:sterol desaturase/sphingolipid hydroxylase (fatty acid hydroxylase superfamily)
VAWADARTGASTHGVISDWPFAAQVVLFVVTHDLYIYVFHRAQHHHRWLWRLHEAHHSAREVDWIAGARSHALEILVNQTVELGAMILLGADPEVILCKGAISTVWGMWIHANVDVRSGRLQYLINGPELHRWHHAIDYPGDGANYGTKLAIWDWLFGTAYRPPRRPAGYGLAGAFPRGYLAQFVFAFRRQR